MPLFLGAAKWSGSCHSRGAAVGAGVGQCRLVALAKGFAATKFLGLGYGCPKANGQDHGKQGQHLFIFDSFTLSM